MYMNSFFSYLSISIFNIYSLLSLYIFNIYFFCILQVWAGNEACEPVTWRECKLVPRQVDFKVPKIDCEEGEEIPYTDMEEVEKTQMTTSMTCEVKHTSSCKPVTSTKCSNINYQECAEVPEETCETIDMKVPKQVSEFNFQTLKILYILELDVIV